MDSYINLRNRIVARMNHDHIILASLALGGIVGFLLGYAKGHEHGKIAGRIALSRARRALEQVGR